MSWRNIMIEDGDLMKLHLDNLIIFKSDHKYSFPLSDIGIIVLDGDKTQITSRLLASMSKYNVCLIINDMKHLPCGIYMPLNQNNRVTKVLKNQIAWDENKKGIIWKEIVKKKVHNQIKVLEYAYDRSKAIEKLKLYKDLVRDFDSTNREAYAAKVYFKALFGEEFVRNEFDITNSILNYGYTIFRSYIARLIVSHGYNPSIGIFHKSEYNNFCLADDIVEIFRPIIDFYAYKKVYNTFEPIEIMSSDIRFEIICLLQEKVIYEGKKMKISTVMDKIYLNITKFIENESDELDSLNFEFI